MTTHLLVALALALAPACSGGGPRVASESPRPPVATSEAPSESPAPAAKRGTATVTYRGRTAAWPERGCETTRGVDGSVVGWLATFGDGSGAYVQLRVRGYTGAGTYAARAVSVRIARSAGAPPALTAFGARGQSLVLRAGGRAGTYRHGPTLVELACDPADDTSTAPGPAVPRDPVAGTAYVERPEGAVFAFDHIECTHGGPETVVEAGEHPRLLRVVATGSGRARVELAVHGVVLTFAESSTTAEVARESGTFRSSPDGTSEVTRGAWTCDH